ncbi:MAG: hypothetical protein EZS26_002258 [Candidatus Ordinivivax streblomastigis]|uniref:Uncharacterized protein n=1 Tax=Candidatus Ordinivivax streblomastigis TaxID=2540710 RepID=A0A5M8NZD4_9BACT|nr:MAG: hypothetical protein EZS26_002258 [Candidatus Ordinivivax streblomastigis]
METLVSEKSTKAEITKQLQTKYDFDIQVKAIENSSKVRMFTAKAEKEEI